MKKLFVIAFLLVTSLSFAQDKAAAKPEPNPLVQPMFGNKAKSEAQQRKDEKFLSSCDKSFSNRQEASQFFMERGWEYLNEGQLDTAVYRFNLAWLLNPDNKDTYWAFGLVTASQGDQQKAIGFYEKALVYDPKNPVLLTDVASSYLKNFRDNKKKKDLKKASTYLSQSIATDAANAYALSSMAMVKYFEEDYSQAWDYLHKSRSIDMTQFDYNFLTELMAKMPDPQGFFNTTSSN